MSPDDLRALGARKRAEGDALVGRSSEIVQRFDGSQPMILGHHSYKGARRDQDRSDSLMRRAVRCYDEAARLEARADVLDRKASIKAIRDAAPAFARADIATGDIVWTLIGTRRLPHKVARVNAKSVSVETGYSWTDRIGYDEIVAVTKREDAA